MFFKQFYDNNLSQASYLVGCQRTGEAIIIDPVRDLTKYLEVADSEGLQLHKLQKPIFTLILLQALEMWQNN